MRERGEREVIERCKERAVERERDGGETEMATRLERESGGES